MNTVVRPQKTAGFSLVELMVAMALGLVLISGVIQVFLSNKQMFDTNVGVARMQENARFVLAEVAKDLRMAGYRGCNSEDIALTNLVKDGSVEQPFLGFERSLAGYDAETDKWSWASASTFAHGSVVADMSPTADRIIIKNLGSELLRLATPLEATQTSILVENKKSVTANDILFIGDCKKGATVAVTGISGATISFGSAENLTKNLSADKSRFLTADTLVHKLETKSYFIARSQAYTNNRGERPWSLWRKVNDQTAYELAVGVENIQVLYGIDSVGNDGVPDSYTKAVANLDMNNVVVARIQVVTNSIDSVSQGNLSRAFSLTVRLRNRIAG